MPSYPDQVRAAERAAARKRKRWRGPGRSILAIRVAELERILTDRYGPTLPDDDAGAEDAFLMANHLAQCSGNPENRMRDWFTRRCPWLGISQQTVLIAKIVDRPLNWRADTIARRLNLTEADRERLRITTIGAVDMTKENRALVRKQRKRDAAEARRRATGIPTIAERRAKSDRRGKPWLEMNISERTWYRLRKIAAGKVA